MTPTTRTLTFSTARGAVTEFQFDDGQVVLRRLFNQAGLLGGESARVRGFFSLHCSLGELSQTSWTLIGEEAGADGVAFTWQVGDTPLRFTSRWTFDAETGVCSRRDRVTNTGAEEVTLFRVQARFAFAPGEYDLYSQQSWWSNENSGHWQSLRQGQVVLHAAGGRSCQGGTPYCFLRARHAREGIGFHVLPRGNWMIRVAAQCTGGDQAPYAVVEIGLADTQLRYPLPAGGTLELPEILLQAIPAAEPYTETAALHAYQRKHESPDRKPVTPFIYNTWFDTFEFLAVPRLRAQLAAAREVGCEVFVVDAGWYGIAEGGWWQQTGDWREREHTAFYGRMREFADEVRAAGLGFGLWMEPERFAATAPIRLAHPEWFIATGSGFAYPDLHQPEVVRYLRGEIGRLVESYGLAWMKIDFNFEQDVEPYGDELSGYYATWYALLDELRRSYPSTFFEACASGGQRHDLEMLRHANSHFLSDTINPLHALRIGEGALLRVAPGRDGRWVALRSVGPTVFQYGVQLDAQPVSLIAPGGAVWQNAQTVDVDFYARVCLPGLFGLSGDLAGLPPATRARLRHHGDFYKHWRTFIANSVAHLLTPPTTRDDNAGWAALQLQQPGANTSLLFAYRLNDGREQHRFPLRNLRPEAVYQLRNDDGEDLGSLTGTQLMGEGVCVALPERYRGAVVVVEG